MERRNSLKATGSQEEYIVPILDHHLIKILDSIKVGEKKIRNVLDIGCGNQPLRSYLQNAGWQYKSMDVAQNDYNSVDYIHYIDSDLKIDEKFDLLICTEVLEHVLGWEKAFSNFNELCANEGLVLISCPFVFPLHEEPHDFWRPTFYAINEIANRSQFKIITTIKGGDLFDVLGTLLNSAHVQRAANSFLQKIKFEIFYRCLKYVQLQIAKKDFRKYTSFQNKIYLSNIVLLEKCQ